MPSIATFLNSAAYRPKDTSSLLALKTVPLATHSMLKAVNAMASAAPLTADKLQVPITRQVPSDRDIFVSGDGRERFYVPRYDIAVEDGGGGAQYAVSFVQGGDGRWGVQMRLTPAPPPGRAASYSPLEHELQLSLGFHPGGDAARTRKTLAFQEVVPQAGDMLATLWVATLPERDELYHALINPDYRARVTLKRRAQLAVENTAAATESFTENALENNNLFLRNVDLSATLVRADFGKIRLPGKKGTLRQPKLELIGQERAGRGLTRTYIGVTNLEDYSKDLFKVIKFKDGGRIRKDTRLKVSIADADSGKPIITFASLESREQLSKLPFTVKTSAPPVKRVVVILQDRKTGKIQKSEPLQITAPVRPPRTYTLHWFDFEAVLAPDPFLFDPNLHAYVYTALSGPPSQPASQGLVRHRETFGGIVHSYFQDDIARHRIYFLPDDFRITRHEGSFRPPMVTVRVHSNGDETADSEVTFSYAMAPYTDGERLADAAGKIAAATGLDVEELEFQPYLSSALDFIVTRPVASGRVRDTRPSSPIMLQQAVTDTLTMPVTDFQIMFDAMLGNTATALSGEIHIGVDGWDSEVRPLIADFETLTGTPLDISVMTDTEHSASLTLTNAIESPIALAGLRAVAIRDGASVEVSGLDALDTELAPLGEAQVDVRFDGLPGSGAVQVAMLASGQVAPDGAAVMEAILDRSALNYFRTIEVRSLPAYFAVQPGQPQGEVIAAIMVEFEGGQTITLTEDNQTETVRIDFPFSQVILRELEDDGSYTYQKTIIYADGTQAADSTSTNGTASIIYVTPTPSLS